MLVIQYFSSGRLKIINELKQVFLLKVRHNPMHISEFTKFKNSGPAFTNALVLKKQIKQNRNKRAREKIIMYCV